MSALGFLRNLPALLRALRGAWDRTSVLYLKLFYVQSITAWGYNRVVSSRRRKPVATLLVGDASDALLLRDDVFPSAWTRKLMSRMVTRLIWWIQRRVDLAGFWAQFLADKFAAPDARVLVVNESWLHETQIQVHDRVAPRRPATVLFVGRLVARKRANLLLSAIARFKAEGEDLRCVLVGDGPARPALERQARDLRIGERVTFSGWLGLLTPEMLGAYDDADILCLPSFAEGLPLVVVEAMGRGAAVVATAVSGTPEAVEHERSGLLVPRDDLDALTAAIARLLRDQGLWRRCVDGGYAVARRNTFEIQRGRLARAIADLAP